MSEYYIDTLMPGDCFRDWLVDLVGDKVENDRCKVRVYKIPASHTVCRYEFDGQDYGVFAKFYAEPTGGNRNYNAGRAMDNEFRKLKIIGDLIDIPRPLAKKKSFNCALVTERVRGKPLSRYIHSQDGLFDKLTLVADSMRRLHDGTRSDYRQDREFARFHRVLDQLRLGQHDREKFNRLLGKWWYSRLLDQPFGCIIHNDANPANYLFNHDKVYALDFESSWNHASRVHDLGVVAAELKKYFGWNKRSPDRAEPYIGHFLWRYSRGMDEFRCITGALPFFMAMGLLRMARWGSDREQRRYIMREAEACLKSPVL